MLLGIFHHPAPAFDINGYQLESRPVARSWTNEAQAFVDAYAAKSLLWLKGLGLKAPPVP